MSEPFGGSEQTRKLLAAIQEWTRQTFPAPPSGHGGPECEWCPLCQIAASLRGEHPELTERIAAAGTAVVNALQALAGSIESMPAPTRRPATDPMPPSWATPPAADRGPSGVPPRTDRPAPRPRVERIVLDRPDAAEQPGDSSTPDES